MPGSEEDVRALLRARIAAIEAGGRPADSEPAAETFAPCRAVPPKPADDMGADPAKAARPDFAGAPRDSAARSGPEPFLGADEEERAFRKIERLACAREQASIALLRRLAREGYSDEAAQAAVSRAIACGLVDDHRFADVLVRSRIAQGRGRRGIAAELSDLGIDPAEVRALSDADREGDGEVSRALAVLERKPPRAKNRRDAAYRRLVQKGFASDVASTAARLWSEAEPDR